MAEGYPEIREPSIENKSELDKIHPLFRQRIKELIEAIADNTDGGYEARDIAKRFEDMALNIADAAKSVISMIEGGKSEADTGADETGLRKLSELRGVNSETRKIVPGSFLEELSYTLETDTIEKSLK